MALSPAQGQTQDDHSKQDSAHMIGLRRRGKRRRKPKLPLQRVSSLSSFLGVATLVFILSLAWTQLSSNILSERQQQDLLVLLNQTTYNNLHVLDQSLRISFSSSGPKDSTKPLLSGSNSKSQAEIYHEAWYIDDQPDWKAFDLIHEDERISDLVHKHRSGTSSYRPYAPNHSIFAENPSAQHPILTTLRTLNSTRAHFNPVCQRYRFPNLDLFPTLSIICPMQFERAGLLSLTVHSLLARTPPQLLHEIIIVDDNGNEEERQGFVDDEDEIKRLMELSTKIKYIRNPQRLGCAGSRLKAIAQATGEVLVVLDSHVEMYSSTWAQHLLLPILENPRTMSMQTLDILDDRPGYTRKQAGSVQHYGFVNERFLFSYVNDRFNFPFHNKTSRETPPIREPFETPFAPGSLFAIRRDEFWRLGGYDAGLAVWGGENVELVMKVWRCGFDNPHQPAGRVVVVPCSRVGHVYRIHTTETGRWPPHIPDYVEKKYGIGMKGKWIYRKNKVDKFTRLVTRNNLRIFRVWMGKDSWAMQSFMFDGFGVNSTDPRLLPPEWSQMVLAMENDTDIAHQEALRDRNKCKSFEWFDRHVIFRLVGRHNPFYGPIRSQVNCGRHAARECGECPSGHGNVWCNGQCKWCPYGSKVVAQIHWNKGSGNQSHIWEISEKTQCVPQRDVCRPTKPPSPS